VLFIDSIQTVYSDDLEGAAGNVTQVRECAARLQRVAKESGAAVFLVGHVTKGGSVAGPKTLEHIVDTVLYFEETGTLDHRVLRSTKNRFGAAEEIGVFRMTAAGLEPVLNPSELFLRDRSGGVSGTAVAAVIEGRGRCSSRCRRSARRPATARRSASPPASTASAWRCCWPSGEARRHRLRRSSTSSSTSWAACASPRRRPTRRCWPRSPPASTTASRRACGLPRRGRAGRRAAPIGQLERRLAEAARMGFRTAFLPGRSGSPRRTGRRHAIISVAHVGELVQRLWGRAGGGHGVKRVAVIIPAGGAGTRMGGVTSRCSSWPASRCSRAACEPFLARRDVRWSSWRCRAVLRARRPPGCPPIRG
jgi:DNA repair protein RadA/Sms